MKEISTIGSRLSSRQTPETAMKRIEKMKEKIVGTARESRFGHQDVPVLPARDE